LKDTDATRLPIAGGSATITAQSPFVRTTEEHISMSGSAPVATTARRVLVVEDEMLIGMLLEDMLTDMGHTVVAIVPRVNEALTAAKQESFDLAILDVHLHGQAVFPVADALIERGIPFVFATGYGERGLPEQYRSRPILQKPFAKDDLERMLATVKVELGS
jgi:CheY-like chemotaxis protein